LGVRSTLKLRRKIYNSDLEEISTDY